MKFSELPAETLARVDHIVAKVGDVELPVPCGWNLLVLQYVRGKETRGGIILPDQTRKEDVYQGRVGVVVAMGPEAYSDKTKFPSGAWCNLGDWIMWPPVEAAAARFAYGEGVTLALIADDRVLARGLDPVRANQSG